MRTKATTNEQARTIRGGITAEERWWLRACVRAAALLFMGLIAVGAASAAIHRVPEQFPTIRDAMSSSQHGDTILVGPGTYREQVKFFGLEVTLASTGGPDVTVIDANGHDAAIVIQRGQTPATTIDGFTITTQGTGRGILLNGASPRISNNVIRDNHAASGAGIFCQSSSAIIVGNRFSENAGFGQFSPPGGAVSVALGSNPTLEGNTFHENSITDNGGGAIGIESAGATIIGNHFESNSAAFGDAVYVGSTSDPVVIRDNTFRGNFVGVTGFVVLDELTIERNHFDGDALELHACSNSRLVNNTFRGSYVRTREMSGCRLIHNTLFDSELIIDAAEVIAVNTIIWGQNASPVEENGSGTLTARYCNVRGGWPGEENIDVDPRLVAVDEGDLRLRIDSPCVDAGTLDDADLPANDVEGQARPLPGRPFGDALADIGADEMSIAHAARFGTVGAATATFGSLDQVVLVNGTAGDRQREVHASSTTEIRLDVIAPEAGPVPAPFALYAYAGAPTATSPIRQPAGLGWMSFGTPLRSNHAPPYRAIWNNLGRFPRLGFPQRPSQPAPSRVFRATPHTFQPGDVITFQGFILDQDSESPHDASVTNAVVLRVMP